MRHNFTSVNKVIVAEFLSTLYHLKFRCKHLLNKDEDGFHWFNQGNIIGYTKRLWYYSEPGRKGKDPKANPNSSTR
jgi:hypothetical protein